MSVCRRTERGHIRYLCKYKDGDGRWRQLNCTKAAAKPEPEPQPAQAKKSPGEKIKCPDTGKMVDDVQDCPACPHRKGCPQWD